MNKGAKKACLILVVVLVVLALAAYSIMHISANGFSFSKTNEKVLILGTDKDGYRTDIIMVAEYNGETSEINVLQIPRDCKVDTNREDKKVNSVYAFGGIEELYDYIDEKFNLEVDKYIIVNLDAFNQVIEAIGGVEVDVPVNMNYDDPTQDLHIHIGKGFQTLNGKDAEGFIRFRMNNDGTGYAGGDVERLEAQRNFYNAVISKVLSAGTVLKIPKFYNIFTQNVKTDLDADTVTSLMTKIIKLDKSDIHIFEAKGEGGYIGTVSYYILDDEANAELIEANFNKKPKKTEDENTGASSDGKTVNQEVSETAVTGEEAESKEGIKQLSKLELFRQGLIKKTTKIEVLNASGYKDAEVIISEQLKEAGYNVSSTGVISSVNYKKTQVILRSRKEPDDGLKEIFKTADFLIEESRDTKADITIIIGDDISN